jgi:uncharacterized protein YdgA (DUF945 family)
MKKIVAILIGAGIIAVPAATWHFGNQAEANSQGLVTALGRAAPYVTVVGSEYKKGFMSSTQTIRLRAGLPGVESKDTAEIVIENVIQHGPLPGFSGVGAARITHNIIWPEKAKVQLAKVWGDKAPISAVTVMNISGGGSTTVTSPAANGKNEDVTYAFQGLTAIMNFSAGYEKMDYTIASDGATFEDKKNEKLVIGKLSGNGAQTKLAGTESVYIGKQQLSFAGMDATKGGKPAFSLKQVDYSAEMTNPEANFVNAVGKLTGSSLRVEEKDIGDIEYSFNMQKLHAPSLDALNKSIQVEMNKLATSGAGAAAGQSDEAGKAMLNALKLHLPEISKHSPTLSIDKIRVGNAKDYGQMNATVRLMPMLAADFDNPMALLPKVDAAINIELSESAVALMAGNAGSMMGADASSVKMTPEMKVQMAAQTKSMVDQQLAGAVQAGYIVRSEGKVTTQITLKQGSVLVNGKPVGGGMLGK